MLEEITLQNNENGLDLLVNLIRRGAPIQNLELWVERAFHQLESDDSIDAETADRSAVALENLLLASQSEASIAPYLGELVIAYGSSPDLATAWEIRRRTLGEEEIRTELWDDFEDALACLREGDPESAALWVEELAQSFSQARDDYYGIQVLEEEICLESVLGHRFLKEGIDSWLQAMTSLRESIEQGIDRLNEIVGLARDGQRSLMVVQLLEKEIRWSCPTSLRAAY